MKPVEDAFSSDVFRRVVLPGIVLAAGLHPLMSGWIPTVTTVYGIGPTAFLVAEILIFGLAISSAIQWIYYVYEGFRLAPVTSVARRLNEARVERCQRKWEEIQRGRDYEALSASEQSRVGRIYEYLLDFPLTRQNDGSVEHEVERPTRLGNIIATYEAYAETRYGIDGTYFWDHLLDLASDGSRKKFEDTYSFAESLVLASFAGAVVAILHVIVLLGFAIGTLSPSFVLFRLTFQPSWSAWLALFGSIVWLAFYQASLPAHREAGAAFRAIVDLVLQKFLQWTESVRVPPPDDTVKRVEAINEYLKILAKPDVATTDKRTQPNPRRRRRPRMSH